MKKHSILLTALALILGLSAANSAQAEGTAGDAAAGAVKAVTSSTGTSHAQAVYTAALPLLTDSGRLPQAISYLNSNIYAVTSYQATVLVLKLENVHKAGLKVWESKFDNSTVQRKLGSIYTAGASMAKLAASTDDSSLRTLLKSAGDSGYKLETAEGSFFPVIDYAAYRKYKLYVTSDIHDYITIMATESALPSSKDNGLVIGWSEVAARALSQEHFVKSHPKSNRTGAVKQLYRMYESDTFYGQNNTPLFHYDSLEMDLEAQKAYSSILTKNTGTSPFLDKLDGFMKLLKENGYKLDDAVESYRKAEVPLS
ncbi:hypothetical protein R70723_03075 [Paenibacillus sp. FSL R7-0273]|uniref:hypothetical protein n=1 Tax=Paenibacillus sp. FSL R7-0273 TaxID=1536772 RepID=UPI0004F898A0|nr:hypothetical protein [Paenibacillus sp. FSL R7-0273]AIQ44995.1 hypothetical protein R70723_03075 [Paenibacillus sp. FSL R7-0273]OMF88693.1 hypothetical protein BK144_21265 [Paenibacillus sp. FSL R7-0273]